MLVSKLLEAYLFSLLTVQCKLMLVLILNLFPQYFILELIYLDCHIKS